MATLFRVLIGVLGVLGLLAACLFWLDPERAGAGVGLDLANATGAATIRAQIAGFFAASGLFALVAAVRNRPQPALGALVLVLFALFGRIVNVVRGGWSPLFLPPIAIECVTIAIIAFAWHFMRQRSKNNFVNSPN